LATPVDAVPDEMIMILLGIEVFGKGRRED
jgi:hypothetical protein